MADNALQPAVVDIPIGSLNLLPPDHAGPNGRLTALYDAIFTQYQQAETKKLQIDPRGGFASFSNVLRSHVGFGPESGTWANPSFLFALGDQLLSICSNVPRVFNGSDWTHYGTTRVVTERLSESVLHSTNATIAACDHAWIAGVTCSVWTEQAFTSAGVLNTQSFVGIRADDGAWLLTPTPLWPSLGGSSEYSLIKVVADGTNFWAFYNAESSGHKIFINVYDTTGTLVASNLTARNWDTSPGYWDILGLSTGGVLLAQPQSFNASPTDLGVNIKKFTQSGGVITQALNVNNAGHCMGPLAWLTNDLTGNVVYLGTVGPNGATGRLWAYELNTALAVTKEYDFNISPSQLPDNLTGWPVESGVGGQRDIFLSYSQLAGPAASTGPTFDPAYRFVKTVKRTFAGVTSTIRTTQSVIQQSRAFAINGEYHAYTYYQSGSGQSTPNAAQSVTVTDGDYFIGDREQPLAVTGGAMYGASRPAVVSEVQTGTTGFTGKVILNTDTVASFIADGSPGIVGVPIGTPVLKWTFANATPSSGHIGHILKVNGSTIATANFQWDIYGSPSAGVYYTPVQNRVGGTVVTGTFGAGGTVDVVQVASYKVANLADLAPPGTLQLFVPNGSFTISGAGNPGNDGTFSLLSRDPLLAGLDASLSPAGSLWSLWTTQVVESPLAGTVTLNPAIPQTWNLGGQTFTPADLHSSLRVDGNTVTENQGTFQVTGTPVNALLPTEGVDAAGTVAQIFDPSHMPTFVLVLDDDGLRFTASFSLFTFDYTYIGAQLSIANAYHSNVNGVYNITDVLSAHVVRLEVTNGVTGQRSEEWDSDLGLPTVSIQRGTNVQQQTQPEWFVTPLTGSQPQVGAFEKGLAYADWRLDGETSAAPDFGPQDRYRFALSSTSFTSANARQVVLPFRVANFTQVSIASVGATPIDIANLSTASTVGLKIFQSQGHGEGIGDAGKLLLPGLLTAEFTASGFAESNFNIGPEAPFLVSEGTDSGAFALTPGKTYTIQAVFATTLENGDVVRSLPSPPVQFTLTSTNNFAVYGGRLPLPLDATGSPNVSKTFGLTNHAQTTIELYRSVVIDGVPSTQLHLITDPANPNGLYTSGTGSGFSFPDTFTWNYRDEKPDAAIRATEVVYAGTLGQGIAPHYPAPPSRHATTWQNRRWVVGYDGAVWMSAEMVEGEDTWYFPGFRYPFPEEDPAVCVVGFESNLYMLCAHSIWRIGLTQLPNNTLTEGAMPPPVKMPWAMGCSGFAVAMSDLVAYSSSVGNGTQVWAITRNLANVWLSEPLGAFPQPVSAMTVDGKQRLVILAGDSFMRVFDPVAREWALWRPPSVASLVTRYQGQVTYEDTGFVLQQSDAAFVDIRNAVTTTVAIDLTLSSLTFAQVRAVKRLWECQIIGPTPVGSVNINAVIDYPDDLGEPSTTFGPTLVSVLGNLLMAINPAIEDAGSFVIRIFGSYEGIVTPGKCFSIEMLSCEVGVDARQGTRKLPDGFRLIGR